MATSQNGWPVLQADSSKLITWNIPTKSGMVRLRLRNGSAGFVLAHFASWYSDNVEPLVGKLLDDWGWALRAIRGKTTGYSNHASGTAIDLNATRHPLGREGTIRFLVRGTAAIVRIRARLLWMGGVIRGGAFYLGRKDEMHYEVNRDLKGTEKAAKRLMKTPRGKAILEANPGQRQVILS